MTNLRDTRAWHALRLLYRRIKPIAPLDWLLTRRVRIALGMGVPYPFAKPRPADRGAPPAVDVAAMRTDYTTRGLDREPDTFVLYRIIGNDLVPRHRKGQSRDNVAWILENEPELPSCEKRWVLNRIVDSQEEQAIIHLLESHGQAYLRIPFEWSEYAKQAWDIDGLPWPGFGFSETFQYLRSEYRERVIKRLYRHKNNCVINNNGARNTALEDGLGRAKWILPWDGNCFVTTKAWEEIMAGVQAEPWKKYFLVPMARMTDNDLLLDPGYRPEARDEPQILFRRDAGERFDEAFFYGRRPKVELFWRLGVPGKWDDWVIEPWDLPCPDYSPEAGQYGKAGWVARLFSGRQEMETGRSSDDHRRQARVEAVTGMLDSLDARILGERCERNTLFVYDREKLVADRAAVASIIDSIQAVSDVSAAGDENDAGLPERMHAVLTHVLAAFASNEREQVAQAQHHLAALFVDDATRLPAAMSIFRHKSWRKRSIEQCQCVRLVNLACLLDGVRLLDGTGRLGDSLRAGLEQWLRAMLDDSRESDIAKVLQRGDACNAAWFDLLRISAAAWLEDWQYLSVLLRDNQARFLEQFSDNRPVTGLQARAWWYLGRWRAHCPVAGAEALLPERLRRESGFAMPEPGSDDGSLRRYNNEKPVSAEPRMLPPFSQFT